MTSPRARVPHRTFAPSPPAPLPKARKRELMGTAMQTARTRGEAPAQVVSLTLAFLIAAAIIFLGLLIL